ncbi:aldehyde dehydrogenase [Cytidiella melzeri]|nr:aldehyde dehydrogenase [Cytidiella melzeri]
MASTYTHHFDSHFYKESLTVNTGLFIDGKWVEPIDKGTFNIINAANDQLITTVSSANAKDVDLAVDAAKRAFKNSWGFKIPGSERGRMLNRLADLMDAHKEELAALEALNSGKHFLNAKNFDLTVAIDVTRYYAGWADKNHGQTIETHDLKFAYTRHEPIGVCGLIAPWNFPLMQVMCKMAPALATGNSIIIKPSEFTPLTALKLMDFVVESGFPAGVVNVVTGTGPVVGQAIVDHPGIGKVSFTGSTSVGRKVMEGSSRTNLKRVTLELGGKSPSIIFDDANFEQALKWVTLGIFNMSGQMCMAGSRIFVQEGVYNKFIKAFVAAAEAIKQGDMFDPECHQGPVVSETQMNRVLGYIESGKAEGATVITGGERNGNVGCFVKPTIFTDVKPSMKIVQEEIFGPVGVVVKFKDEQEVIELANDTVYGLSSSIFTRDISRALRVAHSLEAGQAYINSNLTASVQVPFGGIKQSGFGSELGQYALDAYTTVKAVHVNIGLEL